MSIVKLLKMCVVMTFLHAAAAHASTASSDITDMWWNPDESGWGVNVILQKDVAFLTFFVYDAANNPVWYTSDARLDTATAAFNGDLYATKGPWLGGPFTGGINVRKAGTVSLTLANLNQATLTYSVDGVSVTKTVQRQTWASEDYSGTYIGGYSFRDSSCSGGGTEGVEEAGGALTITQTGTAMTLMLNTGALSCNFSGTYNQTGKIGTVAGSFTCSNNAQGPFVLYDLSPTLSGFTGRVTGQNQLCTFNGYLGGIRRTP
jgi:hypothetical protein